MISSFWDFSVRVYAQPGVSDVLLNMQNTYAADVNLLLYCAWHASSGRGALSDELVQRLDLGVAPWRTAIVKSLRELRERIKTDAAFRILHNAQQTRAKVLEAEFAGEQVAQQLLESLTETEPATVSEADALAAFKSSLEAYWRYLDLPESTRQPVEAALRVAFRNN